MYWLSIVTVWLTVASSAQECIDCHTEVTPEVVAQWQVSRHDIDSANCIHCHGSRHLTEEDVHQVSMPVLKTCEGCHEAQAQQFKSGKHSRGWNAMKSIQIYSGRQVAEIVHLDCAKCHMVGVKSVDDLNLLKWNDIGSTAFSCDACHTGHQFSVEQARKPETCGSCHGVGGFDQYSAYKGSVHYATYLLKPEEGPSCVTCHVDNGSHYVSTGWGTLGVRLPLSEDPERAANHQTVMQAFGALPRKNQPAGGAYAASNPISLTPGLYFRRTTEAWRNEREKMVDKCLSCHPEDITMTALEQGDRIIFEADRFAAEAVQVVEGLYRDGLLSKRQRAPALPDVYYFGEGRSDIERRLSGMFHTDRARAFKGMFHINPEYAQKQGLEALKNGLAKIKEMAAELRKHP